MTALEAYIFGLLIGLIVAPLLVAGAWMKIRYLMLKYELWLVNKQHKRYVNQLHNNGAKKRKV